MNDGFACGGQQRGLIGALLRASGMSCREEEGEWEGNQAGRGPTLSCPWLAVGAARSRPKDKG